FAVAAPRSWWEFFRFNAARPADWDSLWFIGCHRLTGQLYCGHTGAINLASAALFVIGCLALWRLRRRRAPGLQWWTLGFPILVVFLLTNKVYSPQYGLWLLPWFALALPDLRLFALFEAADVAVFLTRFSWFGRYSNLGGLPIGAFEIAVLVRSVVLLICLAAWVRRPEPGRRSRRTRSRETGDAGRPARHAQGLRGRPDRAARPRAGERRPGPARSAASAGLGPRLARAPRAGSRVAQPV